MRLEALATGWVARCLALAAAYVALGYVVAAVLGLPLHWPLPYMLAQARWAFLLAYSSLAVGYVLTAVGPQRSLWRRLRHFLASPNFFFELAGVTIAVQATIAIFDNLKQHVPAMNETLYDSPLWRFDAWLHFGAEPAVVATELAAAQGLLPWLDRAYFLYYPTLAVVPLLFLLSITLRPLRGRFFVAYCLIWMLGGLIYLMWPALGPVYYRSSRFVWLDQAPYAQYLQDLVMHEYVRCRTDPGSCSVKPGYGIAALPNLHVAVLALFAIACRPWRPVAIVLWSLTAITFLGSLALGWHYAVAGYAGAALAWLAWWVACRVMCVDEPEVGKCRRAGANHKLERRSAEMRRATLAAR